MNRMKQNLLPGSSLCRTTALSLIIQLCLFETPKCPGLVSTAAGKSQVSVPEAVLALKFEKVNTYEAT